MLDKLNNSLAIGDKVAVLHKKRPSTTSTLQVGVITRFTANQAVVEVEGMKTTRHHSTTIVKIIIL